MPRSPLSVPVPVGVAPLCKCGCGQATNWQDNIHKWATFIRNHHARFSKPRTFPAKPCRVCSATFVPTAGNQLRCEACIAKGQPLIEGTAPLCRCGCGETTKWAANLGTWREFIHNHHGKFSKPHIYSAKICKVCSLSYIPTSGVQDRCAECKSQGPLIYRHICKHCKKKFKTESSKSIFCSPGCSAKARRGENSPFWRGSKKQLNYVAKQKIKEHRAIMEGYLGRSLTRTEVVYHIDENKQNNEKSNLHLFHCTACHSCFHVNNLPLKYVYHALHKRNDTEAENRRREQAAASGRKRYHEKKLASGQTSEQRAKLQARVREARIAIANARTARMLTKAEDKVKRIRLQLELAEKAKSELVLQKEEKKENALREAHAEKPLDTR